MVNYVAVYGSLRKNASHNALMQEDWFYIKDCFIPGELYHVSNSWFPALKKTNTDKVVKGDIYYCSEDTTKAFNKLDRYEGYSSSDSKNSLYIRELVKIPYVHGFCWCWVYYINPDKITDLIPIDHGDWLKFVEEHKQSV